MKSDGFMAFLGSLAYLPHLMAVLFLALMLFGFFEDRKGGKYKFRGRRFIVTIAVIFTVNLLLLIPIVYYIDVLVKGAEPIATEAILKNRAISDFTLKNLSLMFPEKFDAATATCYRAGLSNYIEDQWNKSFSAGMWKREKDFCTKHSNVCNGTQEGYYDAIRPFVNPHHILYQDFSTIGYFLGSDWITASDIYDHTRRLFHEPDSRGKYQDPPDEKVLAEYHHYLIDCATFKPVRWANPEADLVASHVTFCVGACP